MALLADGFGRKVSGNRYSPEEIARDSLSAGKIPKSLSYSTQARGHGG
jgi:hypothetical protein